MKTILSGDVGGTNTRLAVLEPRDGKFVKRASRTVPSADYPCLEDAITDFFESVHEPCSLAAIGVAGPVVDDRCEATNLPWIVDTVTLKSRLGFKQIALLNDLKAQALGIHYLQEEDIETLHAGTVKTGNRALIAAGTGLGQAGLFYDGHRHRVFATEGGHADFAPHDETHIELLRFLTRRYGRASWERVVSGSGLVDLFRFLVENLDLEPIPELALGQSPETPSPADISAAALEKRCPVADRALDVFVQLYGAEAGNLALKTLAVNGLFVGGGIAPKILERLKKPLFLNALHAKGRMSTLVRDIPVRVILNGDTALYGAASVIVDPV